MTVAASRAVAAYREAHAKLWSGPPDVARAHAEFTRALAGLRHHLEARGSALVDPVDAVELSLDRRGRVVRRHAVPSPLPWTVCGSAFAGPR